MGRYRQLPVLRDVVRVGPGDAVRALSFAHADRNAGESRGDRLVRRDRAAAARWGAIAARPVARDARRRAGLAKPWLGRRVAYRSRKRGPASRLGGRGLCRPRRKPFRASTRPECRADHAGPVDGVGWFRPASPPVESDIGGRGRHQPLRVVFHRRNRPVDRPDRAVLELAGIGAALAVSDRPAAGQRRVATGRHVGFGAMYRRGTRRHLDRYPPRASARAGSRVVG